MVIIFLNILPLLKHRLKIYITHYSWTLQLRIQPLQYLQHKQLLLQSATPIHKIQSLQYLQHKQSLLQSVFHIRNLHASVKTHQLSKIAKQLFLLIVFDKLLKQFCFNPSISTMHRFLLTKSHHLWKFTMGQFLRKLQPLMLLYKWKPFKALHILKWLSLFRKLSLLQSHPSNVTYNLSKHNLPMQKTPSGGLPKSLVNKIFFQQESIHYPTKILFFIVPPKKHCKKARQSQQCYIKRLQRKLLLKHQ